MVLEISLSVFDVEFSSVSHSKGQILCQNLQLLSYHLGIKCSMFLHTFWFSYHLLKLLFLCGNIPFAVLKYTESPLKYLLSLYVQSVTTEDSPNSSRVLALDECFPCFVKEGEIFF